MVFPLNLILFIIGISIAFIGLYTGFSYIPFYYFMLKPADSSDFWREFFEKNLHGDEYVLDIGCGTGRVSIKVAKLLKTGKVVGIDVFTGSSGNSPNSAYKNAQIEGVIHKTEFKYGSVLEIPYLDNTFDMITSGSVLHDIHGSKNKLKAMKEIYRVLKPGGKFIVFEIFRDIKLYLAFLIFAFVWQSKDYWIKLFKKFNFKDIEIQIYSKFLNYGLFIIEK